MSSWRLDVEATRRNGPAFPLAQPCFGRSIRHGCRSSGRPSKNLECCDRSQTGMNSDGFGQVSLCGQGPVPARPSSVCIRESGRSLRTACRISRSSRHSPPYSANRWATSSSTSAISSQTSADAWREDRSEEHTSELQSHVNLVCRLLLEKKK